VVYLANPLTGGYAIVVSCARLPFLSLVNISYSPGFFIYCFIALAETVLLDNGR